MQVIGALLYIEALAAYAIMSKTSCFMKTYSFTHVILRKLWSILDYLGYEHGTKTKSSIVRLWYIIRKK
jgi:hypothetical protein